jgi:hypothetical protein
MLGRGWPTHGRRVLGVERHVRGQVESGCMCWLSSQLFGRQWSDPSVPRILRLVPSQRVVEDCAAVHTAQRSILGGFWHVRSAWSAVGCRAERSFETRFFSCSPHFKEFAPPLSPASLAVGARHHTACVILSHVPVQGPAGMLAAARRPQSRAPPPAPTSCRAPVVVRVCARPFAPHLCCTCCCCYRCWQRTTLSHHPPAHMSPPPPPIVPGSPRRPPPPLLLFLFFLL